MTQDFFNKAFTYNNVNFKKLYIKVENYISVPYEDSIELARN